MKAEISPLQRPDQSLVVGGRRLQDDKGLKLDYRVHQAGDRGGAIAPPAAERMRGAVEAHGLVR